MNSAQHKLLLSMLEQQEGMSPEMRTMLGQMMGTGDDTVIEGTAEEIVPSAPGPEPAADDAVNEIAARIDALRQLTSSDQIDLAAWRDEAERNERIIEALTDKLDMLACALGACPGCWGSDDPCTACGGHGRGGPGAFLPDPECFDAFVTPVLHLMAGPSARHRTGARSQPQDRQQQPTMEI